MNDFIVKIQEFKKMCVAAACIGLHSFRLVETLLFYHKLNGVYRRAIHNYIVCKTS